jgi:hypothetical protein
MALPILSLIFGGSWQGQPLATGCVCAIIPENRTQENRSCLQTPLPPTSRAPPRPGWTNSSTALRVHGELVHRWSSTITCRLPHKRLQVQDERAKQLGCPHGSPGQAHALRWRRTGSSASLARQAHAVHAVDGFLRGGTSLIANASQLPLDEKLRRPQRHSYAYHEDAAQIPFSARFSYSTAVFSLTVARGIATVRTTRRFLPQGPAFFTLHG